ncbi:diacylglycerol/lipid kinase family protein [Lutispora thermophila]|uniref:Lipid kinase, YegS/Rv2252/BmrU family n=1 Tax=Lutispora thermophila DSM 19022 TaxID=1122184 RepID=A0A1M6F2G4_9FIRM|nr:diacylglycerol kinase family protein [Lutispora thermophila]SHI91861.1 lipid kinase, YegS/Rv2252/BmrU family [Lutispora thermophila DSM 19022]
MDKKVFAIVNPVSANGATGKEWPVFEKTIKASGINLDYAYTEYPMHAKFLTQEALKAGYKTILSVGGDGTMNEVLNGFFYEGMLINENASLSIFSRGTGCDTIRTIGIDKDVDSIIEVLKFGKIKLVDVGIAEFIQYEGNTTQRYFLNVSDIGIGAQTTYRVNRSSKALKGFLSFLIGALSTMISYKNKDFEITIDDITINEKLNSIIIANGKYFGGGMKIAPMADMSDGYFDIIIIGNISKFDFLLNFPKIYKGTHMNHPKLLHYKGKKIKINAKQKALIEVDGEQPGVIEANINILPNKLKILV